MTPASELSSTTAPDRLSTDPDLAALCERLAALSLAPGFSVQRELAVGRVLRPYLEPTSSLALSPLMEEMELADEYVYADFFPEDGQLDLIEQLRDMIEVHVPEAERAWLDPLHHSALDLLEVVSPPGSGREGTLLVRSLGDHREYSLPAGNFAGRAKAGQVLLTRLVHRGDQLRSTGPVILLSARNAQTVFEGVQEWRRELEITSGSFALGEWAEFTKRYGYILLWQVAGTRLGLLMSEEAGTHFLTAGGKPFFYALALYDHHNPRLLSEQLNELKEFTGDRTLGNPAPGTAQGRQGRWLLDEAGVTVAQVTLTPTQLTVECDSAERLDQIKHRVASVLGFLVRFRGEATTKPSHTIVWEDVDLRQETAPVRTVIVSVEEEQRLLRQFLESAYMEWADQPSPAFGSETPRHRAASAEGRAQAAALIDEMEGFDLGRQRTGTPAFDYDRLRSHLGLT